jgi:hypothetical protein
MTFWPRARSAMLSLGGVGVQKRDSAIGHFAPGSPMRASVAPTPRTPGSRAPWRTIVAVSLCLAAVVPLVQFSVLYPLVGALPTWDQWSMAEVWDAHSARRPVLPLLLKPYQGHLNFMARSASFGLGLLDSWNMRAEIVACYVFATGTLILFVLMLRRTDFRLLTLALPAAALGFSVAQYENFLAGYQMGQHMSQMTGILALFLLSRRSAGRAAFLGAMIAAVISTFSYAAGLAVWPAGMILVLRGPVKTVRLGTWAFLGAACGVAASAAAAARVPTFDLLSTVAFFLAVIGQAFTWTPAPAWREAILTGAAVSAAFLGMCGVMRYRGKRTESLPWLAVGAFAFGSAALIGVGRQNVGWDLISPSHYVTAVYPIGIATLAFCGIAALEDHDGSRACQRIHWWPMALTLLSAVVVAQVAVVSLRWVPVLRSWSMIINANNCKLVQGTATDEDIRRSHHPDVVLVRRQLEILRVNRLAVYADPGALLDLASHCSPRDH